MKFNELKTTKSRSSRRVGRGISAGRGKTAGRGTKGQKARAGSSSKPGFAGGQTPMIQKLPKLPGFKSHHPKAVNVYTGELDKLSGKIVDANALYEAGIIADPHAKIKLVVKGDLTKKITVKLPSASKSAIASIEAKGGTFEKTDRLQKKKTTKSAEKKS